MFSWWLEQSVVQLGWSWEAPGCEMTRACGNECQGVVLKDEIFYPPPPRPPAFSAEIKIASGSRRLVSTCSFLLSGGWSLGSSVPGPLAVLSPGGAWGGGRHPNPGRGCEVTGPNSLSELHIQIKVSPQSVLFGGCSVSKNMATMA